ncbi:MAG: hypothetical protein FWD68_06180 [Alphaproteobacteria bacterium]|nr:hypothetical protein [Alphaproteobacteria bacterium]
MAVIKACYPGTTTPAVATGRLVCRQNGCSVTLSQSEAEDGRFKASLVRPISTGVSGNIAAN